MRSPHRAASEPQHTRKPPEPQAGSPRPRDVERLLRGELQERELELAERREAHTRVLAALASTSAQLEDRQKYLNAVLSSTSWRMTASIRKGRQVGSYLLHGLWAWGTFRPGSRPHRLVHKLARSPQLALLSPQSEPTAAEFQADPPVEFDCVQQARSEAPIVYLFVDHTVGCNTNTGIQRTLRGLASGLIDIGQPVRFVKWNAASQACVLISATERARLAQWNGPDVSSTERHVQGAASRSVIVRPGDWLIVAEATWITDQPSPVTLDLIRWSREHRASVGFVFYDAIPLRRPELNSSAPAQQYMRALSYADAIWSISDWSAADLTTFLLSEGSEVPPIYTIPLPGAFDSSREAAPSQSEQLILSVGTIEPRKNQVALVRAFQAHRAACPDSSWRLVLAGNLHPLVAAEIEAATKTDPAISYAGHVSDAELARLFERCAFTVFPSVEEGFGLPILESVWHGKPCLCADFGSMAEVAHGGGCLTCDTRDEAALANALARLIDDSGLRAELATQARERQLSSWSDYARSIVRSAWPIGQIYFLAEATCAWDRNTGIQRIVRQLARSFLELGLDVIPVKLGTADAVLEPLDGEALVKLGNFNGPSPEQWRGWLPLEKASGNSWFIMPELPIGLPQQGHTELLDRLRALGIRSSAIFYDAIPWKMDQVYPDHYRKAHANYMTALAAYDLVAAISEHTRNDLVDFWKQARLTPRAGDVTAAILPGEFKESEREKRAHVPSRTGPIRIVSVGTVEPRKNHEALLQAFVKAAERSSRELLLTLVGSNISFDPTQPERIGAFIAQHPSIVWERDADDARIRRLYEISDFSVYPSVEEGYGLPIVESLWHGRPVICANFGAMKEVAEGGGCVMVDVRDVDALADAILSLAEHPARIEALSREAIARHFRTWQEYAGDLAAQLSPPPLPRAKPPADLARRAVDLRFVETQRRSPQAPGIQTIYLLVESAAAYDRNTGIQRVVRQIARALIGQGAAVVPVRWDADRQALGPVSQTALRNLSRFNGPGVTDWAAWRAPAAATNAWFLLAEVQQHWKTGDHGRLIEGLKADGVRCAAIFYDAIPVKMQQLYPDWLARAHYRYMIELGFYDAVFPISEFAASDLSRFLSVRGATTRRLEKLVHALPLPGEFPGVARASAPQFPAPSEPLRMLAVGTVEPRKNHATLVHAFLAAEQLCRRPLDLTIVGNTNAVDPGLADRIRKLIAGHASIRWLDDVGDDELAAIQNGSHLTVYPSIEEGFGLPILESLWHGKPVICADFGAMAEAARIAGGGCLMVDVRNPDEFARAMVSVAEQPGLLERLAHEAVSCRIASWSEYAGEMITCLVESEADYQSGEIRIESRVASR